MVRLREGAAAHAPSPTLIRLVLVGPLCAGNVGACARVAANFGVRDIWIVAPACDWRGREALLYAKGPARAFLDGAREARRLADALEDCSRAVGFTRRRGELRRGELGLAALSAEVAKTAERIALVFGREDAGLTHAEILLCDRVCTFVTAEEMPSLNLSHAVAAALSRLYEDAAAVDRAPAPEASATLDELETLFTQWRATMVDARITTGGNPERMLAHMRRALQRAKLSSRDVGIFRGFLNKTQAALTKRVKR